MTLDESKIKDWRSTGRRKARRALYQAWVPYCCVDCKRTSMEPPKDAPAWFEEIWPEENRVLDYQVQADHESKDYTNNEVEFLNWRCASCHRMADNKTAKGVAQKILDVW